MQENKNQNDQVECCKPIETLDELLEFEETDNCCRRRSVVPLSTTFGDIKVTLDGRRFHKTNCPKTLICHDLKGGYIDDKFINGCNNAENYVFHHWLQTDIFVYFSHKFVTIPPISWINSGHRHGVQVLGTIITEWEDGVKICKQMLKDSETIDKVVHQLCHVMNKFGFDGYLINIENEIDNAKMLLEFVEKLTNAVRKCSKNKLVYWYDSVTIEGKLKWQDELNHQNKAYFDVCDGIYLNYGWNDEKLQNSVKAAGSRQFDVFVGVDVFGRGCFGGGGLDTFQAVEKIYEKNLSIAIFAPGWSFECHSFEKYPTIDALLWNRCAKYFYYRTVIQDDDNKQLSDDDEKSYFQLIFQSDFSRGFGYKFFKNGKTSTTSRPWFNLSKQSLQPCLFVNSFDERTFSGVMYDTNEGFSSGGSLILSRRKDIPDQVSPQIWVPLDISLLNATRFTISVCLIWKSVSVEDDLNVSLEICKTGLKTPRRIRLGSLDCIGLSARRRNRGCITIGLDQFFQKTDKEMIALQLPNDVDFYFDDKNIYDEKELFGWRVLCYIFDVDQEYEGYSHLNGIRIETNGKVSIGFLGMGNIVHY